MIRAGRTIVATFIVFAVVLALPAPLSYAQSQTILSREAVLHDTEIPAVGNPDGDIAIVEYFDFQCRYCRKVHSELLKVVQDDGNVRFVFKDWPIFGGVSIDAAKLVLAAKFQGKFAEAHNALISTKVQLTLSNIEDILAKACVDVARSSQDLEANSNAIESVLARNSAQAEAFGFQGTPSFIIGTFRVPGALDVAGFRQAIKDARAAEFKTNSK